MAFEKNLVLVLVVAACACGDNEAPAARSGTRLLLRSYVYEDGTKQLDRGVYVDSARHEDCVPQRWTDGLRYCTPSVAATTYIDGQCLTKVAMLASTDASAYAADRGVDGLIRAVYSVGDTFARTSSLHWELVEGQCEGPFSTDQTTRFAQIGAAVPRDAFVEMSSTTGSTSDRIRVLYDVGSDGLLAPAAFVADTSGIVCAPEPRPGEASTSCVPSSRVQAVGFADKACTIPAAVISTVSAPDAIELRNGICVTEFGVGAQTLALWGGADCRPVAVSETERYFAGGTRLHLPLVPRRVAPGGRIRPIALGSDEADFFDASVRDESLDTECAPALQNGVSRCMPSLAATASVVERYPDAACTHELAIEVAYVPSGACDSPVEYVHEATGTWRRLGAPYDGTLYELFGVSCYVADTPFGVSPRAVGPALPDDAFARVSVAAGY